jgi:replication initiation protein RepC
MEYTPVSSFRRPISLVQLKRHADGMHADIAPVSKWDALRRLATARQHYGLSDRDLTVLQTLLGFHPETEIGGDAPAIVYPSNKVICERLNGMPCSTMRRHIARLVDTGVILRRDSPNGKRYVRRGAGPKLAFGFDLTPLAARFAEFTKIATEIEATEARRERLRDTVSLMRRDLAGYIDYGISIDPNLPVWDRLDDLARLTARDLRRKLDLEDLDHLRVKLHTALEEAVLHINAPFAKGMSTSNAEYEQHHQNSDKEYFDEKEIEVVEEPTSMEAIKHQPPPLRQVLSNCPEIQTYSGDGVRNWNDLIRLADTVSPMMGIEAKVWTAVKSQMGQTQAASVLAAMLERFATIKSPSAYLRVLGKKAELGIFSSAGMIRALNNAKPTTLAEPFEGSGGMLRC